MQVRKELKEGNQIRKTMKVWRRLPEVKLVCQARPCHQIKEQHHSLIKYLTHVQARYEGGFMGTTIGQYKVKKRTLGVSYIIGPQERNVAPNCSYVVFVQLHFVPSVSLHIIQLKI